MSKLLFFELCCCLSELGFKLCTPLHHPRPFTNLNHVVWNCISVIFSCYSCVGTQSGSTRKGCLFFMGPKVTKPKVFCFFVFFCFCCLHCTCVKFSCSTLGSTGYYTITVCLSVFLSANLLGFCLKFIFLYFCILYI